MSFTKYEVSSDELQEEPPTASTAEDSSTTDDHHYERKPVKFDQTMRSVIYPYVGLRDIINIISNLSKKERTYITDLFQNS